MVLRVFMTGVLLIVRRVLAHRCASQRIWFTRFNEGPQAHRPLRFIWKNTFNPWAAPNFREAPFWVPRRPFLKRKINPRRSRR